MKLLLIDGNSIMNRAFYGIKALSNKKGQFTNALTGFMNIWLKLVKEEAPDLAAAAFDVHAPTFRHKMYEAYKGTRHGMPEELQQQMPIIKQLLAAMGVAVIEKEGWEADDILGTLSRAAAEKGLACTIMTGDRDSFQLISDSVTVRLASNKEDIIYTPAKINEVYGVTPRQMLEVKTLMGDSSDNIPGVAGIGEKTALSLIQKYGSVEYIYANLDTIDVTKGVRAKLESGRESAELSRRLAEIDLHAPVDEDMDKYRIAPADTAKAAEILTEMEMFGVMKKLGLTPAAVTESKPAEKADAAPRTDFEPQAYDVILAGDEIRMYHNGKPLEFTAELLADDTPKHTFDAKALYYHCMRSGLTLNNATFDITLAAYLLNVNASDYSLERLCAEYGAPQGDEGAALKSLCTELHAQLEETGMSRLLTEIELPLAEVLSSMELDGIAIDTDALHEFGEQLLPQIDAAEKRIHELAGHEFKVNSPKQLSKVLFEELGLPAGKKRATGYSTDAETLEAIADTHEIVGKVLEYRTLTKLYSTYVKGLEAAVSPDGRLHTTFKQTETRTGRISSAEPNIQNIPVRTPLGRNFRKFFTAGEGMKLIDADYSQIELRVLAHLAEDKNMIRTFIEGGDIHTETAAGVFGLPEAFIDADTRRKAKAVNFGIVYGIGAFSLSKDINTSVFEAKRYIESYLNHYSGVKSFMERVTESAERTGYAVTMFGRRRQIAELKASNKTVQALGKRIAMNTPIQGTAADIIKLAMVHVWRRLRTELPEARLILQVHDELIVEAPEALAEKAAVILREEMEGAVKLSVPLTADANIGRTWSDAH
ncbi:MAG: DNA polymerase I [Oscillospiraceae bacterium]